MKKDFLETIEAFTDRTKLVEVWSLKSFQKFRQYLDSPESDLKALTIAYLLITKTKNEHSIRPRLFNTIRQLKPAVKPKESNVANFL
jgi:hypothetical protein